MLAAPAAGGARCSRSRMTSRPAPTRPTPATPTAASSSAAPRSPTWWTRCARRRRRGRRRSSRADGTNYTTARRRSRYEADEADAFCAGHGGVRTTPLKTLTPKEAVEQTEVPPVVLQWHWRRCPRRCRPRPSGCCGRRPCRRIRRRRRPRRRRSAATRSVPPRRRRGDGRGARRPAEGDEIRRHRRPARDERARVPLSSPSTPPPPAHCRGTPRLVVGARKPARPARRPRRRAVAACGRLGRRRTEVPGEGRGRGERGAEGGVRRLVPLGRLGRHR